jgi:hypothetical protein
VILSKPLISGKNQINIENQNPGLYYLRLKGKETVLVEKIVIK